MTIQRCLCHHDRDAHNSHGCLFCAQDFIAGELDFTCRNFSPVSPGPNPIPPDEEDVRVALQRCHELITRAVALIDQKKHGALTDAMLSELQWCDTYCPKFPASIHTNAESPRKDGGA